VIDKPRHGGHGNSVNKLLWKKRERQLVSCSDDRSAMVWRLQFNEL
jgi:WD repeat-containing protein 61